MNLGEIFIDVSVSEGSLSRIEKQIVNKTSDLKKIIKINVDNSKLHDLNKLLDVKIAHIAKLNAQVIKPTVDTSGINKSIDDVKQKANELKDIFKDLKVAGNISANFNTKGFNVGGNVKVDNLLPTLTRLVDYLIQQRNSPPQNNTGSDVSATLKEIENRRATKEQQASTQQGNDKFNQSLLEPFRNVATGVFQGIGGNIGNSLGAGIKNELEKNIGQSFKSIGENFIKWSITKPPSGSNQPQYFPGFYQRPALPPQQINKNNGQNAPVIVVASNSAAKNAGVSSVSSVYGSDIKSIVTRNTNFIKGLSGNEIGDLSLAEAKFFEIKEAFKKAYAKFNTSLTEGNISLARAYSRTLEDIAKSAFIEIDSIKNSLAANGVSNAFGSKLSTMAGSTKGVITSRYVNPSKRNMGLVEQQETLHNQTLGIGKEVLAGVTQGLGNTGVVGLASDKVGKLILSSLKNSLGIASPSKKAAAVMLDVIKGLLLGLESGTSALFSKMQSVGSSLLGSFKKGVNTISKGSLFPTFADKRAMIPERQEFGTEAYFDKVWGKASNKLTEWIGKGLNMKYTEARETTKELGAAVFSKSMLAHPATTTLALFAPLAQAIAPLYVLFSTMRDSIIMPLLNTVRGALERTEPIKQSLNFIAGSKEAGTSELGYLSKVSDKYGTGLESGAQGYIQLSAAAAGTKLEGQGVKELYEGISASIRAMNLSAANGSLVFQAYTQMLSKGKISMEELRQQLAEKSPQALQIFAKAMGVSVAQLQVMSAKGQLISEEVLPRVAQQLKATFKIDSFAQSYISSIAKMQTASFNFSSKVADYFGGMFGGAVSFGADLVNAITSKFKYISTFLNVALIGVMAQVAVGTQAIMGLSVIKPKLEWFQNLVVSSFKLSMKTISPFMFGIFVDMFDDILGAKNSINQNMAKGVTSIFMSLASLLDNASRNFKGKSLFQLDFDVKPAKDLITSLGEGLRGLFSSVPSGVIEFGALFVMLESLFVLGKMLLVPMLGNLASGIGAMARSFIFAASSGETWKGILRVLIADSSLAKGAFIAAGIAAKGMLTGLILAFAQSDFADPLNTSINKAKGNIITGLNDIKIAMSSLDNSAKKVAESLASISLPSKGLQLNPLKVLGISQDGYTTDDMAKDRNKGFTGFMSIFNSGASDNELALSRDLKKRADSVGLNDYFTGNEKSITLGQQQLLNTAQDLTSQNTGLEGKLKELRLTADTFKDFFTPNVTATVKELQDLDAKLLDISKRKQKLGLEDSPYADKEIRRLDAEYTELSKIRALKVKPLGVPATQIGDIKAQIAEQLKSIESSDLPLKAKRALKKILEPQQKMIEESELLLRNSKIENLIEPLLNVWQLATDKLDDNQRRFETTSRLSKNVLSIGIKNLNNNDKLTPEDRRYNTDKITLSSTIQDAKRLERLQTSRKETLNQLLAVGGEDPTNTKKDVIDKLRKQINDDSVVLSNLQQQAAVARQALIQGLVTQSKQVGDYYQSVARQIEQANIEIKKLNEETKGKNLATKVRTALTGLEDGFFNSFIEGIASQFEQISAIKNQKQDLSLLEINNKNTKQDAIKSAIELSRSVPGEPIKVPIDFDLSNPESVQRLTNGLNEKLTDTKDLTSIIDTTYADMTSKVKDVNNNLSNTHAQTSRIKNSFDEIADSIKKVTENGLNLHSVLGGVGQVVGTVAQQSANLLTNLNPATLVTNGIKAITDGTAGNMLNNFMSGIGKTKPYEIYDSNRGHKVTNYNQLTRHHANRGIEKNRDYADIFDRQEEIRQTDFNGSLVKKDFVLKQSGNTSVGVPSPIAGYVKTSNDFGIAGIYRDAGLKELVAQVLHLSDFAVKTGDLIKRGQVLGTQGGRGAGGQQGAYATHTHVEAKYRDLVAYVESLAKGEFNNLGGDNIVKRSTPDKQATSEGLTTKGKAYLALLQKDPRVKAFLTAVATAEVGKTLVDSGKGYGKQIGGDYSKEEFANPENLTSIPASLPGRGGQNAFGRYQIHSVDLEQARSTLGVKNLSPLNQDLIGIERLDMRGALKEILAGNIEGAIKKAGNEFASLEGSKWAGTYGNATTEGGRKNTFLRNYALNASLRGESITPEQMQSQIRGGLSANITTLDTKNTASTAKAQAELEAAQLKRIQDNEKTLFTQRENRRQAEEKIKDTVLETSNQSFKALGTPTTSENYLNKIENQNREFDKLIENRKEEVRKAAQQIKAGKDLLSSGVLTPAQTIETLKGIDTQERTKQAAETSLKELTIAKELSVSEQKRLFTRSEMLRQQTADLELETQSATQLQAKIEALKSLKMFSPSDISVATIPTLERELALKQLAIDTTKQQSDIESKMFSKELDATKGNAQIANLKAIAEQKKINIGLTFKQAEAERLNAENALKAQRTQLFNELADTKAKNRLTAIELRQKQNPTYGTVEALSINRDMQMRESAKNVEVLKEQRRQQAVQGTISSDEYKSLTISDALNAAKARGNISDTYSQTLLEQKAKDITSTNDRLKQQDSFTNQPKIDLLNVQAGNISTRLGGNQFVSNALSRQAATMQENIRYAQQLRDLEAEIANKQAMGVDITGLEQVRENLAEINKLNLMNITQQFKTFGETVNIAAAEGIKSLSQGLTDVILKGGDLGDVFKSLADTILNSIINNGISSILSGLLGGNKAQTPSFGGSGGGGTFGFIGSLLGGILGFASGGDVPSHNFNALRNSDSPIGQALKREGSNSVLATLTPGERVLTVEENNKLRRMMDSANGVLSFKDGGIVPGVSTGSDMSQVIANKNTSINIDASINSSGKSPDERDMANAIRAVVISELNKRERQRR